MEYEGGENNHIGFNLTVNKAHFKKLQRSYLTETAVLVLMLNVEVKFQQTAVVTNPDGDHEPQRRRWCGGDHSDRSSR